MFRPFTSRTVVWLLAVAGVVLTLCGAVMWVLPGPGLPVLLLGVLCLVAAGAVRLGRTPRLSECRHPSCRHGNNCQAAAK